MVVGNDEATDEAAPRARSPLRDKELIVRVLLLQILFCRSMHNKAFQMIFEYYLAAAGAPHSVYDCLN
jgi:hypothetical protein